MSRKLLVIILILSIFSITGGIQNSEAKPTMQWLAAKYPQMVFNRGYPIDKKIALTFDDGPDNKVTYKILDILKEKQVKATFFIIGANATKYPESLQRIHYEGHVIGNHTWSHSSQYNKDNLVYEVLETEKIITQLTGQHIHLFRPPYGIINEESVPALHELGFQIIGWNSDSLDWRGLTQDKIVANIFKNVAPGTIVLQHSYDNPKLISTVSALPEVIDRLSEEGYTFATIPELIIDIMPVIVKINKEPVNFTEAKCLPKMKNKTVYSPLRSTFENLGAQIIWDPENKGITINKNTDTISMNIGSQVAYINSKKEILETPPQIDLISNQTMIPVRFVCEKLDTLVDIKLIGNNAEVNIIDDTLNNINIFSKLLV